MPTFSAIAELLGAPSTSDSREILRVASIEAATPVTLVFVTDLATLDAALRSPAGAILVKDALLRDSSDSGISAKLDLADPRLIRVPDPRYGFALAARFLKLREEEGNTLAGGGQPDIHPTAVLGKSVQLGSGTRVGPHAFLGDGISTGEGCVILANVTIYPGTSLGRRVVVQAGAILGSTGFGYARNSASGEYLLFPQQGTLVIEDDVEIGANTTIDRGALGETRIGQGTKIDNLVHIGHNCVIGRNVIIAAQTGVSGSSVIEDGAILGGQVGLGEHAHVGPGVILGGGAGVLSHKKLHGPGQVFWGRPARPLKQYLRDLARLSRD